MAGVQPELETLVREVIRRLQQEYGLPTAAAPPTASREAPAAEPGTLLMQDRVVSLALIGENEKIF